MAQPKDITNIEFGRLTATSKVGKDKFGISLWNCYCDCGNNFIVRLGSLTSGATKSCGCLNNEVRKRRLLGNKLAETHKLSSHYLYQTWSTMKQRCDNPNHAKYYLYGKRGIKVCDSWKNSFEQFLKDMGDRPVGHTLNRIDNDGGYCKENCEWSSVSEQNRNRRQYTKHISNEIN